MAGAVDADKVAGRVAARRAADEYVTLILEESHQLAITHGVDSCATFVQTLCEQINALTSRPEPKEEEPEPPTEAWQHAVLYCDEIVSDCAGVTGSGETFAASVAEVVEGIRSTIMEKRAVSANQSEALQNMHAGVLKWLKR